MIPSLEAVRAISRERQDAIVVSTMSPNRYWETVTENPDRDLPIFGAMPGDSKAVAPVRLIVRRVTPSVSRP